MPVVSTLSGSQVSIDLLTRDFEGFRSDVLDTGGLADLYASSWTDRSELDVGVALVEAFAYMADVLSYYLDRIGNEALFPAAIQRRSIIKHCKLLGYELRPNVSASVDLTFVTNGAGTVPSGTKIDVDTSDGSDPQTFELESDFVATAADTYTGQVALHGTTVSETLGSSDGTADQRFELSSSPLTLNSSGSSSLEVYVSAGGPPILWAEVDNFLESESTDQHYRIEIDEYDVVTVIFGDGVNGAVPASGTNNVTANYRVGGGYEGNQVGPNKLTVLSGSYAFVDSVTNPAAPSGGQPKETLDEAKENAPASLRALNRCVTHEDYKVIAKQVSGVSDSNAFQGNGVYEERIVISASGSNPVPSGTWDHRTETGTGLLGSVGAYIISRKTTPVIIYIEPVVVVDIYLKLTVYLLSNTRRTIAERYIEDIILEALDPNSLELGIQLPESKIADIVEDLAGVDYIDIDRLQREPTVRNLSNSLSDITFGSWDLPVDTPRQNWIVEFTNSTSFKVSGSTLGLQVSTGTLDSLYTVDAENFSFLISSGAVNPSTGNKWRITTGPYIGNIDTEDDEICRLKDGEFELTLSGGVS